MICKECKNQIPIQRIKLGFRTCTECSNTEAYGTIDITYHKTGNTVQHIDKETANKVNTLAKRSGFGSSLGKIKSGGHKEFSGKIDIGASTAFVGSKQMFDKIGKEAMFKLDLLGLEKALDYIERKYQSASLNDNQFRQLKEILSSFSQPQI